MKHVALLVLLLAPLLAQAHPELSVESYVPDVHYESTPATGPVQDYEACFHRPGQEPVACGMVSNGAVFHLRVRAYGPEVPEGEQRDIGMWSEPARVIFIPEPGSLLLLAAGVGGLGVLRRVRG